ncbi:MAG: thiosulfate oxidation carrier protein SoxY [Campylobacteraceae bacterium 4484_4]|nr:MAG: thiosulfate oxidation carrier protein SoxY [Campylobacteraceae bacterium 4484_4]
MERRKFLGFGLATLATIPMAVNAKDFRKEKPDTWKAKSVKDAIEKLYGSITPIEKGVKIKTPDVASNGGQVPVTVKSDIDAKTVAVFQDVNPESTVAVFDVPEGQPVDFSFKIKMKKSGTITAIVEGRDGKYYVGKRTLDVALGGCEG